MKYFSFTIITISFLVLFFNAVNAQVADTPWPMFRHDLQHTGRSPYKGPENPGLVWKYKAGREVHSSPSIGADGTLYFGSGDHDFYAINPDGTLKWKFETDAGVLSSPAIGTDGTIYFGSYDNYLYALNPDGTEKWKFNAGTGFQSSPVIGADGTIYISSDRDYLYALNPDGTEKWKFDTNTLDRSFPAIGTDGTIYIGSNDDNLYALNPDGTEKWKFNAGTGFDSSPAIGTDGTIYIGSDDNLLYAINPNGTLKWKFETGEDVNSFPAIGADGTIYVGSDDNYLYALNPDGSLKWKFETGDDVYSSPTIAADGVIYFGSLDHCVYALNPDGTLKWKFETGYYVRSSPAIGADGGIYIGSWDGNLYAIGEYQKDTIYFDLYIEPDNGSFQHGNWFNLCLVIFNPSVTTPIDFYIAMLDPSNKLYFGLMWDFNPAPAVSNVTLPAGFTMTNVTLLEITIPNDAPPISDPGTYTFAVGATDPGTLDFISNVATVSFNVAKSYTTLRVVGAKGKPGDIVSVNINIYDAAEPIHAFGLDFHFDDSILTFVNSFGGPLVDHFSIFSSVYAGDGIVRAAGIEPINPIATGTSGCLLSIDFQVNEDALPGNYPMTLENLVDHIKGANVVNGTFTITE